MVLDELAKQLFARSRIREKIQYELGSAGRTSLHFDTPRMGVHDPLYDRKTQPGAPRALMIPPPKSLKNQITFRVRNSFAMVQNTYTRAVVEHDLHFGSNRRVPESILRQVSHCPLQHL
jgi:hypothetical protein